MLMVVPKQLLLFVVVHIKWSAYMDSKNPLITKKCEKMIIMSKYTYINRNHFLKTFGTAGKTI